MNKGILITIVWLICQLNVKAQEVEVRDVGTFTALKTTQAIDVYLSKGNKESVRVEGEGIKLSEVITKVSGDMLKVYLASGNKKRINVKVYVTYTKLQKVHASSAASIFSNEKIKSPTLEILASSAGSIEVVVDCNKVITEVSSAGTIQLYGKTNFIEADASSAGDIDAYEMVSEVAQVKASSAGSIKVSVSNELEAEASSGGGVRYKGSPTRIKTHSTSGGVIKKIF